MIKNGTKLTQIFLPLLFIFSAQAQMMNFQPCFYKKMYENMNLPPETEGAMVSGHIFRIMDPCIPIDIVLTWKNHYRNEDHSEYQMEFSQILPGELSYRLDREEFVMVANALNFKGRDTMIYFKAKGWYCKDAGCRKVARFRYGQSKADPMDIPGIGIRNTSTFLYGYPETEHYGEAVPEIIDIGATMAIMDNGEDTWKLPIPTIRNLELNPFTDFSTMVDAVEKKKIYSKTITYNHNEDPEDMPSEHKGRVKIDFMFHCPTKLQIEKPVDDARFVFTTESTGRVIIEAEAKLSQYPEAYLNNVVWSAPEKNGSSIEYQPASRKGKKIRIIYKGLPKLNRDFGKTLIKAELDMGERCGKFKATKQIKLFFPRDSFNNPGPSGDPNWYYYWQQTKAGHGTIAQTDIRYHGSREMCSDHDIWGYYPYDEVTDAHGRQFYKGRDYFYICNFNNHNSSFEMSPIMTDTLFLGIDTFAVSVLHEMQHRKHWKDWWNPGGGWPVQGYYTPGKWVDRDLDYLPDKLESGLGFKKNNKYTFESKYGRGTMYDEHILTYKTAETGWEPGSADKEDWAKPGHQWE